MNLKQYVNSNINVNNLDFTEQARIARFNKYVDVIEEKYKDNNIYNYFINYYRSIGNSGINCILIFTCLISYDENILNQKIEIIDDIVTYLYEDKINFYFYGKYLNICLLNIVTNWLDVFHVLKNTRQANFEPNIILTIIFRILNPDKQIKILEKDINSLLEEFYDIFDPVKRERWFDDNSTINDIYNIILSKMENIQTILTFTGLKLFVDEYESLEQIKRIKYLDEEAISKYKEYVLKVDSLDISDANKVLHMLSIVKDFVKENEEKAKIISFEELKKKYENR